jgi:cell division septation protein DedD
VAVAYTNWSSNPCSDTNCRDKREGRAARDIWLTYQLPDWLARTSVSTFFSTNINGSPHLNLRMHHPRAWDAHNPADLILQRGLDEIKTFLQKGKLSIYDLYGENTCSVLWLAYFYGTKTQSYEMLRLLLQAGADPFQKSEFAQGLSVVSAAFERLLDEPQMSQELASILPIGKYLEESDFTPLHLAVLGVTHIDVEKMLSNPTTSPPSTTKPATASPPSTSPLSKATTAPRASSSAPAPTSKPAPPTKA